VGWVDPRVGLGVLVVGREFLILVGWVRLGHGSEMAYLRKTDVVYITTLCCPMMCISLSFYDWLIVLHCMGAVVGSINSPGSGLGWVSYLVDWVGSGSMI